MIHLRHAGKPVPQGRPKFSKWGVYYGKTSKAYRKALVASLQEQHTSGPVEPPVSVTVEYCGMRRNGDPDNLLKQILDALQDAGVLAVDTWPNVPDIRIVAVSGEPRVEIILEGGRHEGA